MNSKHSLLSYNLSSPPFPTQKNQNAKKRKTLMTRKALLLLSTKIPQLKLKMECHLYEPPLHCFGKSTMKWTVTLLNIRHLLVKKAFDEGGRINAVKHLAYVWTIDGYVHALVQVLQTWYFLPFTFHNHAHELLTLRFLESFQMTQSHLYLLVTKLTSKKHLKSTLMKKTQILPCCSQKIVCSHE